MNSYATGGLPADPHAPYALASVEERLRRVELCAATHMAGLTAYLEQVRTKMGVGTKIPAFDPLDGGVRARVLVLLEAPGPLAVETGFVSRNNPDPTARNLCQLLEGAHIGRADTLIWNVVPWYVGDGMGRIRPVSRTDVSNAMPHLGPLLALLPDLRAIVLVGKKAQAAAPDIRRLIDVTMIPTHHPSARVFNIWPEKRVEAEAAFTDVSALLVQDSDAK